MSIRSLVSCLILFLLPGAAGAQELEPTFSHTTRLRVTVHDPGGKGLVGAIVRVCEADIPPPQPSASHTTADGDACRPFVANAGGEVVLDSMVAGAYTVSANLDGYSETTVGPFNFNAPAPITADRVVILLNPVCFDCRSSIISE